MARRKAKGLSREAMASDVLSYSTLARAERGVAVYAETAGHIAAELGVPLSELLPNQQANDADGNETARVAPLPDATPRPKIAVLPFELVGNDVGEQLLAQGIAQDLLTRLSRWWFPVLDAASTIRLVKSFEGEEPSLGAKYLVNGTVLRSGEIVRVSVHLTDADSGCIIWGESREGALTKLFDRQNEIVARLVSAIGHKVLDEYVARFEHLDPEDLDAWQQALRGEWHFYRRTSTDNSAARDHLAGALSKDQRLPLAWYSLALTHQQDIVNQWTSNPSASIAAMKIVCADFDRLFPGESWSHIVSAYLDVYLGRRESAMIRLAAAIEGDPNACLAYALYGQTLAMANQPDASLEQFEMALRLSPRDTERWSIYTGMALSHFAAERYEEAIACATQACRIRPSIAFAHGTIASAHARLGNLVEAKHALGTMLEQGMTQKGVDAIVASTDPEIARRYLDGLHQAGLPRA